MLRMCGTIPTLHRYVFRWVKRDRNQQDATNLMFIIKLLSQHVSGIIMPVIRRIRVCTAAYGVLHWLCGAGTRALDSVEE